MRIGEVYQYSKPTSKSQPSYKWTQAVISSDQDCSSYPPLRTNSDDIDSYHASSFLILNSTSSHYIQKAALIINVSAQCAKEDRWCFDL